MFPLRDSLKGKEVPVISLVLIALNIIIFLIELTRPDLEVFITQYAFIPARLSLIFPRSFFSLISFQFLHAGFFHLFSNMWFLWVFGDNVEGRLGKTKFLFFYLFCGAVAGFSQYLFSSNSSIPMLGASGSVAGVLGAYLALFPYSKVETLVPSFGFWIKVAVPAPVMLGFWFFTQLFSGVASLGVDSAAVGGIALFAHIGGFVAGWLIAQLFKSRDREDLPQYQSRLSGDGTGFRTIP